MISVLLASLLWWAPPCGGAQDPPAARAGAAVAAVEAGSGEVSPGTVAAVRALVAERLPEVQRVFPGLVVRPFRVQVHADRESMPAELVAQLHPGAAGFALLGQHQIHLVWGEMRASGSAPGGVVAHELVHELLDQFVAPHGDAIPRWFHEGLAQLIAGDTYLGAREEDLLWRFGARRMLSFGALREHFPADPEDLQAAYAQSYSYVAWLAHQYDLETLLEVARSVDRDVSFMGALVGSTGRTTLQLEDAWRYHLRNESGASWRILVDQCFNLMLIACLPLLGIAVMRRFARERRAAARLARSESEPMVMESVVPQYEEPELHGPPLPPGFPTADAPQKIARDAGAGW